MFVKHRKGISFAITMALILSLCPLSVFAQSTELLNPNYNYITDVEITGTTPSGSGVTPNISVAVTALHNNNNLIAGIIVPKDQWDAATATSVDDLLSYQGSKTDPTDGFGFGTIDLVGNGDPNDYVIQDYWTFAEAAATNTTVTLTWTDNPLPKQAEKYFILLWSASSTTGSGNEANYYGFTFALDANGNLAKDPMDPPQSLALNAVTTNTTYGGFTGTITATGAAVTSMIDHYVVDIYQGGVKKKTVEVPTSGGLTFSVPLETGTIDADKSYTASVSAIALDGAAKGDSVWVDSTAPVTPAKAKFAAPAAATLAASGTTQNILKLNEQTVPTGAKVQYQIQDQGVVGSSSVGVYSSWTDLTGWSISGLTQNHNYKVKLKFVPNGAHGGTNYSVNYDESNESAESAALATKDLTAQTITFAGLTDPVNAVYGDGTSAYQATISPQAIGQTQTITYGSSNADVVSVNSSGTIKIVGVGTATITASAPAVGMYAGGSASYTVNVSPKALTVNASAKKVYDGNNTLTLGALETGYTLSGKMDGDDVSIATLTGTFRTADVHSSSAAAISAVTLTGAKAGNYTLTTGGVTINGAIEKLAIAGNPEFTMTYDANSDGAAQVNDVYTITMGSMTAVNLDIARDLDIQWLRNGSTISGATGETYTVTAADLDQNISVSVKAKSGSNYKTDAALVSGTQVPGRVALSGTMTISGSAISGSALGLDISGLNSGRVTYADLSYQWLRNGTVIAGANTSTYAIQQPDLGTTITAIATALPSSDYTGTVTAAGKHVTPEAPDSMTASLAPGNGSATGTWSARANGDPVTYHYKLTFNDPGTTIARTRYVYETSSGGATGAAVVTDSAVADYIFASPAGIDWYNPLGTGVTTGTAYKVLSRTADPYTSGGGIKEKDSGSTADTSKVFSGLTNGVEYTLEVYARNVIGTTAAVTAKAKPEATTPGKRPGGGGGGGGSVETTKYTVTYDAGDHGTIAEKTEQVEKDKSPKGVKVTADEGWVFAGWSKDGKTVIDLKDVKVTGAMKLIAVYEKDDKIVIPDSVPDDLRFLQVSKEEISGGYVNGYQDGTFRPDNAITRAEVAAIVAKTINYEKEEGKSYTNTPFGDVARSEWYADDIGFVASLGVIAGYKDGTFKPNSNITRAEFVTMAMKIDRVVNSGKSFKDMSDADWYAEYVKSAAEKGYATGYLDGTFRPNNPITRAEAVTIINSIIGLEPGAGQMSFTDVPESHWAYSNIKAAAGK